MSFCRSPASSLVPMVLLFLGLAAPLTAAPIPAREVEARRDRVFEDPSLQTELPGWEIEGRGGSGTRRSRPARDWRVPEPPSPAVLVSAGRLFQWLLLALAAVALVMLVIWLTRELVRKRRRSTPRVARDDDPTEPDGARGATGSPRDDDLETRVRRGEYGAAIHLLLLRALERLAGRGRRIPAGRTSREVLSSCGDLAPSAHGALAELVAAVESYLFGGREPGRGDFERCRHAFGVVERALSGTPGDASAEEPA